jgi:drug/metabolite transporter (DMT)-like permease
MLNLESVFTALLAWIVFKENANKRVVLGMVVIVLGGIVLSWQPGASDGSSLLGLFAISLAGLCWAIDNNLTRKVSAADALFIACSKGVLAGVVNCTIGVTIGEQLPELNIILSAMTLGLFGFGISLVLFILALRGLGAARTGAYFATAPFIGSAVAILTLGESVELSFWIASVLMLIGVWLHLTEVHDHMHTHEPLEHEHFHSHDEHHQHKHEAHEIMEKPHSHLHRHDGITHQHPHFPDIHHQHSH